MSVAPGGIQEQTHEKLFKSKKLKTSTHVTGTTNKRFITINRPLHGMVSLGIPLHYLQALYVRPFYQSAILSKFFKYCLHYKA